MTYATYLPSLLRGPLAGPWGSRWLGAVGAQLDAALGGALDAGTLVGPLRAPVDALAEFAADRALEQLPAESDRSFRARVHGAWAFWPWAGTRGGLETAADLLGYTIRVTRTARDLGRDPWAQWFLFATDYSRSWRAWGGAGTWGAGVWGSDAPRDEVRRARRFLRLVSNARDRGWLVFVLSLPGWWGCGAWGDASATWGGKNIRWKV